MTGELVLFTLISLVSLSAGLRVGSLDKAIQVIDEQGEASMSEDSQVKLLYLDINTLPEIQVDMVLASKWFGKKESVEGPESVEGLESDDYKKQVIIHSKKKIPKNPIIKTMGPFDSGTNFVHELNEANHIPNDGTNMASHLPAGGMWKHWPMQWRPLDPVCDEHLVFIKVARHPLAWLQSVKAHSYDVDCADWNNFAHCQLNTATGGSLDPHVDMKSTKTKTNPGYTKGTTNGIGQFDDLIELWNLYYAGYLQDDKPGMIIRYEDLLSNPAAVMKEVGKLVNVEVADFKPYLQCAKDANQCKNSDFKTYNLNKLYMADYSPSLLARINKKVDHKILKKLGYSM